MWQCLRPTEPQVLFCMAPEGAVRYPALKDCKVSRPQGHPHGHRLISSNPDACLKVGDAIDDLDALEDQTVGVCQVIRTPVLGEKAAKAIGHGLQKQFICRGRPTCTTERTGTVKDR